MKIISIVWMVLVALSSIALAQSGMDECEAILPAELKSIIKTQYAGYRIGRVSDYDTKTVKELRGNDPGKSCLAATSTDVDGDTFPDYGFFLIDPFGQTILLAARNPKGKHWQMSKLLDFPKEELGSSYVEVIEPGFYEDMYAQTPEYEVEDGRVEHLESTRAGFLTGTIDASGVAFFFSGTCWIHLWLSD